jgi:hypothetical protein
MADSDPDSLEFERTKLLNKIDMRLDQMQRGLSSAMMEGGIVRLLILVAVAAIAIKLWFFNA